MNPVELSQQLQKTLVSYLSATFDVNRDGKEAALASFIQKSLSHPRALFAGPYLELTPPYKTGETLQGLADQGVVASDLLKMQCFKDDKPLPVDAPLYTHQEKSLRKLCVDHHNIVVSSGTGSGKTECFLLPILNDLLIDPSPGVRAVLIYPLNALVNDQLDRLRILLRGTNITFGRYTSELAYKAEYARKQMQKEWEDMEDGRKNLFDQYPLPNEIIGRDQIQESGEIPQILITNYAMLEYLLLRPKDNPLFNSGKWRFIVLDEAHSYSGAQGIEVGLLMRRLKHRLGHQTGETRCIATSATLTNDDALPAKDFAEALFGEDFNADDIIFGELDHGYLPPASVRQVSEKTYVNDRFGLLLENVRRSGWKKNSDEIALLMQEVGLISEGQLGIADKYHSTSRFLWETLRGNNDLIKLRKYMLEKNRPMDVEIVAEALFQDRLSAEQRLSATYNLIELASMARPSEDEVSLLPARYHLFVRPPQGVWACLNPDCPDKSGNEHWSKLFATPRETCDACQKPVYPVVVCRTCGQVYLRLQKVGRKFLPVAAMGEEAEQRYVTWHPIYENLALAEDEDEDEDVFVQQSGEGTLTQKDFRLCLSCQQEVKGNGKCGCETVSKHTTLLYTVMEEHVVKKGTVKKTDYVDTLNECGRCHSRALKGTEIATEITLNALTPLAVLTEELYRALPASSDKDAQSKAGEGRKLLSFYDSRQGAARFAAFVQSVVNQQAYRRIMQEAARELSSDTFWPDFEHLSERTLSLAIQYRVAHNDTDIDDKDLPRDSHHLNQSQQKRLLSYIRKQVFAEITTRLRSRQSLEALGLMSVGYFEPGRTPDFSSLTSKTDLSDVELYTLITYLLDNLRRKKIVTLPDGVQRDDPIFGRNKFSPRLIRRDAGQYQSSWIGKTDRHGNRKLTKKILQSKKLPHDDDTVDQVLGNILDWLIDESDLLDTSRPADGYQLRHDRLFFNTNSKWYQCDQCQRLSSRGDALLCPHTHCQGHLHLIEDKEKVDNFYSNLLSQKMIPMRIEEHTAQLDPSKGRSYQNQFKNGSINMLSCSTTFEMGIDLGDLQAVVMSNIPPTVANYKQRAGRAGRRTSGTAFILSWASNRPHDQSYFRNPAEIIGGRVLVPYINIQNPIIARRHTNAILFSEYARYCDSLEREYDKSAGAFFDPQYIGGTYYSSLDGWLEAQRASLEKLLGEYPFGNVFSPSQAIEYFETDIRTIGYQYYSTVTGFYKTSRTDLRSKRNTLEDAGASLKELDPITDEIKALGRHLERKQQEDIINYLSDRGVLPSYSFPLHTVELRIPYTLLEKKELRLQRNLKQGIREYAPGQEVVADKRIWKSGALDFFGKEPQVFAYHICPSCNHLSVEEIPGKNVDGLDIPCSVCGEAPPKGKWRQRQYIQPDGFRVQSSGSGQPAGQYVDKPFNLTRSALVPSLVKTDPFGQILSMGYDREGALLYVNEGIKGGGFRICLVCGKSVNKNKRKCDGFYNGQPCTGTLERDDQYSLGFKQKTDTLHLKFSDTDNAILPDSYDDAFWTSLKYALLHGASQALQIERKDIDGVLFPEKTGQTWRQTIVLYDNVPGGAGHVKLIKDKIDLVVESALEIVNCDCEKSCYRCLQEYGNQWEHHLLDRKPVATFLRVLDADLQQYKYGNVSELQPVVAVDQLVWLWEQVKMTKENVTLYLDTEQLLASTVDNHSWLDLIQELLHKKVEVRLYLKDLLTLLEGRDGSVASLSHLRLLLQRGLDLRTCAWQWPWIAIIDSETLSPRAIQSSEQRDIWKHLKVTSNATVIAKIYRSLDGKQHKAIDSGDLRVPPDTSVIEVPYSKEAHGEGEFFSDFYKQPVRGMVVNDRYLNSGTSIIDRLGAHIRLAGKEGSLEWVFVQTRAGNNEQQKAIRKLKELFPDVKIKFNLEYHIPHDRYVEITRLDGSKARVIIGAGLDFIHADGEVSETFLVFQELP